MKITLLGDSIRMIGYGLKVPEMLGADFEVFQPEENCRFSKYTLRGVMHEWKEKIKGSDIIHWNNGLWDTCDLVGDGPFTSYEEYEANMLRILGILETYSKKVIFATTTPVHPTREKSVNDRIIEYNKKIVPVLESRGVMINDLHAVVYPRSAEFIRSDDLIHLTDEGIAACSEKVVEAILAAKKALEEK